MTEHDEQGQQGQWMTFEQADRLAADLEYTELRRVGLGDLQVSVKENHETEGYHVELSDGHNVDAFYGPHEVDVFLDAAQRD
jgi:hypothetical protein